MKLYEDSSLFETGLRLATGHGVYSLGNISYQRKYSNKNTILEVNNPSDVGSRWSIYERKRVQSMKPASAYHETMIAKDIANVRRKRK